MEAIILPFSKITIDKETSVLQSDLDFEMQIIQEQNHSSYLKKVDESREKSTSATALHKREIQQDDLLPSRPKNTNPSNSLSISYRLNYKRKCQSLENLHLPRLENVWSVDIQTKKLKQGSTGNLGLDRTYAEI